MNFGLSAGETLETHILGAESLLRPPTAALDNVTIDGRPCALRYAVFVRGWSCDWSESPSLGALALRHRTAADRLSPHNDRNGHNLA